MDSTLKPSKRTVKDPELSTRWREVIKLLKDPDVLKKALTTLKDALKATEVVAEACGCDPLKSIVGVILEVVERAELSGEVQEDLLTIVEKIWRMLKIFERYYSTTQEERVLDFMDSLTSSVNSVKACVETELGRGRFRKIWNAKDNAKSVARLLRDIGDDVDEFVMNINVEIDAHVKQVLDELQLHKLLMVHVADYQAIESDECTAGTRVNFNNKLIDWCTAPGDEVPPICWIYGHAGVGKTTIMLTICNTLARMGRLGGSFFCSRNTPEQRSIKNIFPTIAQSLAIALPEFRTSLVAELSRNQGANSFTTGRQFEVLIAQPALVALKRVASPWQPRVVVIDALDECDSTYDVTRKFIGILRKRALGLGIRFLIASRPEPEFVSTVNSEQTWSRTLHMQNIPQDIARGDVSRFLKSEWSQCRQDDGERDWPTIDQVEELANRSGGLFIYASTAWKYVSDPRGGPKKRMTDILLRQFTPSASPGQGLDDIYDHILSRACNEGMSPDERDVILRCLQAIVCLYEPLSVQDLAILLGIPGPQIWDALHCLRSVLRVPQRENTEPVSTFHASFPDYLLGNRSKGRLWHIEGMVAQRDLYLRSWEIMKLHLHFNVSGCSSSYLPNNEQPKLAQLSQALVYACLRWVHHFSQFRPFLADMRELQTLFSTHFLYWLEVLSIMNCVQEGQQMLAALLQRMRNLKTSYRAKLEFNTTGNDEHLVPAVIQLLKVKGPAYEGSATAIESLANEAKKVVIAFATPIATSVPHIYISALACTNDKYLVKAAMGQQFLRLPRVITAQPRRMLPLLSVRGHEDLVSSIAFSFDGKRVASGSWDNTIRIWDPDTGTHVGEPLRGHDSSVRSVAFSPDGKRVASGSDDKTIRIWDPDTGTQVGEPLRGHDEEVTSVAFSPDGKRIASGSYDKTIRIWDPDTRTQVGEPLRGHGDWVRSVAFSPDGKRVASGSYDTTIRIWDPDTGTQVGKLLRGHDSSVTSVAFSPNGKRVASGASDSTIRIWDPDTGTQVGDPLRGHDGYVISVAFSPDGKRVASGSDDKTIRIWDPDTGTQVGKPLRGHDSSVTSVAFSPDGKRIASGSYDKTIWIWDPDTGTQDGEVLRGHNGWVRSVAFSPDGKRIASGSNYKTIRIWDPDTGTQVGDPLRGHDGYVISVAFSPDGKRVASGSDDTTIRIWDPDTGTQVGKPLRGHNDWINSVAFSPDGKRVASGSDDKTIRIWDLDTGTQVGNPLRGHNGWVNSVAFSPDGKRIASGSNDDTIRVWDPDTGLQVGEPLRGHNRHVYSVAFSPDGKRIASGSEDKTIRIWDPDTGTEVDEPLHGHDWSVNSVAFSPDGKLVVSGSDDKTIRIWDPNTGTQFGEPLRGHDDMVGSVAFSPDGKRVASGCSDHTIRCWNFSSNIQDNQLADNISSGTCRRLSIEDQKANRSDAHKSSVFLTSAALHGPMPLLGLSPTYCFGLDHRISFTLDEDGWLRGPNKELIFWVLPEYRPSLWTPETLCIFGAHPVKLDLGGCPLGEDWTQCNQPHDVVSSTLQDK